VYFDCFWPVLLLLLLLLLVVVFFALFAGGLVLYSSGCHVHATAAAP
jgi:hypothetical protein